MNDMWIKIGLVGADPQLGTLQGRIDRNESFSDAIVLEQGDDEIQTFLDSCIHLQLPFKLFDPIIFRAQRTSTGDVMLGAVALSKAMPPIDTDYLTVNPTTIAWWAPMKQSQEWDQVVASTISGLDLVGGGDLDINIPDMPKGPRLVD